MSTTCSNQNEPVPFEKTPQYLEIQHKQWHQKLKQAGVRGIYEKAESKEDIKSIKAAICMGNQGAVKHGRRQRA